MKKIACLLIFSVLLPNVTLAETNGYLALRSYVPSSINTKIRQMQISSTQSLVTFSSKVNTRHVSEGQKFEIEGLSESGLEATLTVVAGNDRTIQYELRVNHLRETVPVHKPIFLKISAN